jgi:hypothetical protein
VLRRREPMPIEMAIPMISSRRMRRISEVYHDRPDELRTRISVSSKRPALQSQWGVLLSATLGRSVPSGDPLMDDDNPVLAANTRIRWTG